MSSETDNDILAKAREWNLKMKTQLQMLEKMRAAYADLQLQFLKLYTPECLELFESFKHTTKNTKNDGSRE